MLLAIVNAAGDAVVPIFTEAGEVGIVPVTKSFAHGLWYAKYGPYVLKKNSSESTIDTFISNFKTYLNGRTANCCLTAAEIDAS